MSFEETFFGFLVALAAGALIGLERQQDQMAKQRPGLGGVRTFPLIALTGALSALAAHTMGVWPVFGALLVTGAFLAVSYYQEWSRNLSPGIATPIAGMITFFLGVLALLPGISLDTTHRYLLIIASASVVMAVLSFKEPLHRAITHVSDADIYATAKFVILALVVLPLLPNRTMGPLNVLNPFQIGLMVVFIAGISFFGYVCARILGPQKGLATTGILGGLISSTAVTLSMANQVRKSTALAPPAAIAILGASSTMFARMLVIVGILNIRLLSWLIWPLGIMMLVGYGSVFMLYAHPHPSPHGHTPVVHRNPFELTSALQFGFLYAFVLLISKGAQLWLGDLGLFLSSVAAGTTDVDAITLSVTRFFREGLSPWTASIALVLAALTNTLVKALLAFWIGGWSLAKPIAPGMAAIFGVGGLAIAFMVYT